MTVVVRFAVTRGRDEYVSHRRFDRGYSFVKWGPPRTARVWARKADAERMAEHCRQHMGGEARIVSVLLKFGFGDDSTSDVWNTAR